jgi:hypothetical protein
MWDTQIRRPSDLGACESLRTESGRATVGVVSAMVVLAGLLFAPTAAIHHQRELAAAERVEGMGDLKGL